MAFSSVGYDGTVNEVQWAGLAPGLGEAASVQSGLGATVLTSPDRAVRISPGVATAHGVQVESDANVTVQCTAGTRWNTICLRRNWGPSGGTSSIVVVPGTSARAIAAGLNNNPGVLHDQPLWLARTQSGSSVVTELVDLRPFASKVLTVSDLVALPDAPVGTVARVGGKTWHRRAGSGGAAEWFDGITRWNLGILGGSGWAHDSRWPVRYVIEGERVQFQGRVRRSSSRTVVGGTRYWFSNTFATAARPDGDRIFLCAGSNFDGNPFNIGFDIDNNRLGVAFANSGTISASWWADLSALSWTVAPPAGMGTGAYSDPV